MPTTAVQCELPGRSCSRAVQTATRPTRLHCCATRINIAPRPLHRETRNLAGLRKWSILAAVSEVVVTEEVETLQINEVHGISLPEGVTAVQEPEAPHELMAIASIRAEAYYEEQPHRCAFPATLDLPTAHILSRQMCEGRMQTSLMTSHDGLGTC